MMRVLPVLCSDLVPASNVLDVGVYLRVYDEILMIHVGKLGRFTNKLEKTQ